MKLYPGLHVLQQDCKGRDKTLYNVPKGRVHIALSNCLCGTPRQRLHADINFTVVWSIGGLLLYKGRV